MIKIKQLGNNLIIIDGESKPYTITVPKSYNTDKIFALAFKVGSGIKIARVLFDKEIAQFLKPEIKDNSILEKRIEKKKIEKQIKEVKKFDVTKLPITLNASWQRVLQEVENKEGIQNFLTWLSLNDIKHVRDNFLSMFSAKHAYITKNGYLASIRAVHRDEVVDRLQDFINSSYTRIKGWKKSPKNYSIWEDSSLIEETTVSNDLYVCTKQDPNTEEKKYDFIGNLDVLKDAYKGEEKITTYVSNYSREYLKRKDNWTIGSVAKIHDKNTSGEVCGMNMLHILSNPHDAVTNTHGNYGDVYLIVLVNPAHILGISEGWKYTTSEFYISCEIPKNEILSYFEKNFGDCDLDYLEHNMKEIEKDLSLKYVDKNRQYKKEEIAKLIQEKKALDKNGIVLNNNSNHLDEDTYAGILKNRIQLLNKEEVNNDFY